MPNLCRVTIRQYLMKRRMRKKVKRAFKPYREGKKTFIECQSDALVSLLGKAVESI